MGMSSTPLERLRVGTERLNMHVCTCESRKVRYNCNNNNAQRNACGVGMCTFFDTKSLLIYKKQFKI